MAKILPFKRPAPKPPEPPPGAQPLAILSHEGYTEEEQERFNFTHNSGDIDLALEAELEGTLEPDDDDVEDEEAFLAEDDED